MTDPLRDRPGEGGREGGWPVIAPPPTSTVRPRAAPPTFSVVVAAYQAEQTLAEALDSALSQSVPPWEVVVCDDGSSDGTAALLASYGERIRVVRQENRGEAAAKNAAVEAATGEFVVVLDADDVFLPRRLEALGWLAQQRPDLDVLTTDAIVEADGLPVRNAYHAEWRFPATDQRTAILTRNFVLGLAAVRRERWLAVGGFDETLTRTTDWDFWLRMILSGSQVGLVAAPLARYRLSSGTLSSDRDRLVEARITVLRRAAGRDDLSDAERRALASALDDQERELRVRRARSSLAAGGREARRANAQVLRDRRVGWRTRVAAAAAVVSPRVAAWWRGRRDQGRVEIGSGLWVRRP